MPNAVFDVLVKTGPPGKFAALFSHFDDARMFLMGKFAQLIARLLQHTGS